MPKKKIADIIQSIFDENGKPFMKLSELPKSKLGFKSNQSITQIHKYLEKEVGDLFMFKKVGRSICILKPCDPSELVLAGLSRTTPKSPDAVKNAATLLNKKECAEIINELTSQGKIRTIYTGDLQPRLILVDEVKKSAVKNAAAEIKSSSSPEYTQGNFKKAFDELDKGRIFVRICDLRRALKWPREVFDNMLKDLRRKKIIQLHTGDASLMTVDEVNDCFVDDNNFRMGSVTWNDR